MFLAKGDLNMRKILLNCAIKGDTIPTKQEMLFLQIHLKPSQTAATLAASRYLESKRRNISGNQSSGKT